MLVEIHMLQNHAPSNLNRDDTGSPKDCLFGGVLRARISSQCLKRSIRQSPIFRQDLKGHLATRTRRLPKELKGALAAIGCDDEACSLIAKKATMFGSGKEGDDGETRQLIFLDPVDVEGLARDLKALYDASGKTKFADIKIDEIEKNLPSARLPRSVDIAMFGRFTTTSAFEDVEASMQVAHAFSTAKVEKQFDYFTAVDDLVESADEVGAGMIGDVEFNSATYYKYFSLDWNHFVASLGGDDETARIALDAFIRAAALTTPSGKQNSFAAHNLPDLILAEVKDEHVPTSYANAFVKPIRPSSDHDVMSASIESLSRYAGQLKSSYGIEPVVSLSLSVRGQDVAGSQAQATLAALIKGLTAALENGTAEAAR